MQVGVVGGGIIGLAVARRIAEARPDATVTVLEKERDVGLHQTGHNSGVVHAGIYYAPGSLKARLCRRGVELLRAYCAERGLPLRECGKLVVALDSRSSSVFASSSGVRRRTACRAFVGWSATNCARSSRTPPASPASIRRPRRSPTTSRSRTRSPTDVRDANGEILLSAEVTAIRRAGTRARVETGEQTFEFDRLVICAGLQSDRISRLAGDEREPRIVPFRGEYHRLRPERSGLVRGLLYPVPDPGYPFLGVHFTNRVAGGVDVGPNAVLAFAREGYRRRDVSFGDLAEALGSRGFRALARANWRMGARELRGSLFKSAFAAEARRYVPEVTAADLVPAAAGVRAQALGPDGSLLDDFRINELGPVVAVRNAPSPGATSSLAIAEHIVDVVLGAPASA